MLKSTAYFLLFLVLYLGQEVGFAQTQKGIELGKSFSGYLEKRLVFDSLGTPDLDLKKQMEDQKKSYSLAKEQKMYVREIKILNEQKEALELVLDWGRLEFILANMGQGSGDQHWQVTGLDLDQSDKSFPESYWRSNLHKFTIPPETGVRLTFLIQTKNQDFDTWVLRVYGEDYWQQLVNQQNFQQGLFFGLYLLVTLSLLAVYSYERSNTYLYLFIYCAGHSLSQLPVYGYWFSQSNLEAEIWWCNFSQIAAAALVQFIREALNSRQESKFFDNLLLFLIFIRFITLSTCWLMVGLGGAVYQISLVINWADLLTIPVALWSMVYFAQRGNTLAKFLIGANLCLIIGLSITLVASFGYFDTHNPAYFLQLGSMAQIFVIGIGLALELQLRFNLSQQNQAKVLVLQKEVNQRLERKVVSRTRKLEEANEEIKARNSELQLQQEEIQSINNHLENLVQERAGKITRQNQQLRDYAFFNAHKVRGPLARILGLIYLVKLNPPQDETSMLDFIHKLDICSQELDRSIKDINSILSEDDLEENSLLD